MGTQCGRVWAISAAEWRAQIAHRSLASSCWLSAESLTPPLLACDARLSSPSTPDMASRFTQDELAGLKSRSQLKVEHDS